MWNCQTCLSPGRSETTLGCAAQALAADRAVVAKPGSAAVTHRGTAGKPSSRHKLGRLPLPPGRGEASGIALRAPPTLRDRTAYVDRRLPFCSTIEPRSLIGHFGGRAAVSMSA